MSESIIFGAIDPALRNLGLAKLSFDPSTNEIDLLHLKLVETEKDQSKQVRTNSSDLRRAHELYLAAHEWLSDCAFFAAEVPTGTQSARGAMSNGMMIGLLAALRHYRPLIEVQIGEVKKVATGRKTGSKEEMIQYAVNRFPHDGWPRQKRNGEWRVLDKAEHLADAVCIGLACVNTHEFKAAVAMRRAMERVKV